MDYLDLYCERLAPGLTGEPLNALSNIAFFIAALALLKLARHQQKIATEIWLLIGLMVAIGTGSTLFHTFATQWSNRLDVIPILLFQLCFLWLYTRRVLRIKPLFAGILIAGFVLASQWSQQFFHLLNGSLSYAPALLILGSLGIYHYQQQKQEPLILLAATGVFFVALFFRTLDKTICPEFPLGTHFLWHLLNGVVLYLSTRGLILNWLKTENCKVM
ncbi:ceramidase domain-containing protein [Planktothrix pseudagardhii]|uniref:Ceramidase n=1 Tax=Planktothrix pseudagardhii TaxID=132604 RepID=A0A9W4CTK7_9CYAN|nr:ceramidase domain-containing protein [Planktothrix pseudagardhii]CAD5988430.1 hypothetical protein NO713_05708 [Planktothrix pseudagardhii]